MLHPLIVLTLAILPITASASFSTTKSEFSQQQNHPSVNTPLQELEKTQIKNRAREWGLTTEEWLRYEQLKQGRRGVLSPGLDPITLLGIEARSDQERQHFADLSVKQDFQRVEAELAFQRAVNAAWQRVFPDVMPIQPDLARGQVSQERLALFVRADCVPCDSKVATLIASQRLLDIYLVDSEGKDDRVRVWARKLKIPVERINNRTITLNHDRGQWLKFGKGRMPVVLQQGEMQ